MVNSEFFSAGAALAPRCPSYVERSADAELFDSVLAGHFCYVPAPHHMGKSSLMLRTAWKLEQCGVSTTTVDLSGFGSDFGVEQPYSLLIKRLKFQLKLPVDPGIWWSERGSSDVARRFSDFLREIVLVNVQGPIVIFVDGLDTNLNPNFRDQFLAAIHLVYQLRATDSTYDRLNFVILGSATDADWIRDDTQSLFSSGRRIVLSDFSPEAAQALGRALGESHSGQREAIFERILYWTGGHPYLTQRLCMSVAQMWDGHWTEERLDSFVARLFRSQEFDVDPNLHSVENDIKNSERRRQLLNLYREVYDGKEVEDDEQSSAHTRLKLFGLLRAEKGRLKVRNEVYRLAFNLDWIKASMPFRWVRHLVTVMTLCILLLVGVFGFSSWRQARSAIDPNVFIDSFSNATGADERLVSLAELFRVGDLEDEARRLFYEELSPADQLALFELANPRLIGEALIIVVRGVYVDPNLENNQQGNALLGAMSQSLHQLENVPSLGAIELGLEINQWLRGREYYNTQGRYQRAIDAYSVAISLNSRNPGVYHDRGLAYAAQGQQVQALADFTTVLKLDGSWETRVQQALTGDPQLAAFLSDDPGEYRRLVALIPTPTSAPTPTPTSSPAPTPTNMPVPPTFTPTSEPTSIPADTPTATATPIPRAPSPTSTATPTPTPGVPTGTITLLSPLSLDDPSYGPTIFEWQWPAAVPPGYGFEVRVWREGERPVGAHDALLDNSNGNVVSLPADTYRLSADITDAAGVQGRRGVYLWTVALVQISPTYADLGQQAEPARLRFEAVGTDDDGGDTDGGGVGID
jgi:tetratricopeptide (TPR) repeat protein